MKNFYKLIFTISTFFASIGIANSQCDYTITMNDSFGDGWNGASVAVSIGGSNVASWSLGSGSSGTDSYTATNGDVLDFTFNSGSYDSEITFTITAPDGSTVYSGPPDAIPSSTLNNEACLPPSGNVITSSTCYNFAESSGDFVNGTGGSSWVAGAGTTPSSGTGPQGADADGGSGFYFTEASGLYGVTYSMQAAYDFSSVLADNLTFSYHMYGASIGTLAIVVNGTQVWSLTGNQGDSWQTATIDLSSYTGSYVTIAIQGTTANGWSGDMAIDNVCVNLTTPPACASNLVPANSATGVSTGTALSWDAVSSATSYDVYFGTLSQLLGSGLPLVSNDQAGTSYTPSGLNYETEYYWQVIPSNAAGEATSCSAQGFTTSAAPSSPPIADFSASSTAIAPGESITFTDLSTETPTSWSWSISPMTGISLVSGSQSSQNIGVSFGYAGTYSVSLTATNASGTDTEIKTDYITVACPSAITVSYDDISHCSGQSTALTGSFSDPNEVGTYTFNGVDSYGDGWNGWAVDIAVDGSTVVTGFTLATGAAGSTTFSAGPGSAITLTWASGSYASEISWTIVDPSGSSVATGNTQSTAATIPASSTVYTYAWSPSAGLDDASAANPVTSATTSQNYTVTVTSDIGCTGTGSANLTIDAPSAGTISGTTTAFAGQTSTLSSDGSTGGEWTSDDASVATVDISTGVVTAVSTGTANIAYTVGGTSCPDASSVAFTVTSISPSACFDMATLPGGFTNAANGSGAWTSGTTSTPSGGTGPTSDADGGSGFYFTEATGNFSTVHDMAFVVDVSTAANPKLSLDYHMSGANMGTLEILIDGTSAFSVSGDQGASWLSAEITIDPTAVSNASAVPIIIRGTTGAGFASDICIDNICLLDCEEVGTISGILDICAPSTSQLSVDVGTFGSWSSSDDAIATVDASGLVTGVADGSATISYTIAASGSCSESTTSVVTNISVLTSAYGDASTCTGVDALLTGTYVGDGVTFSWSPTTDLDDPTIAIPSSSSSVAITYTVTLTDDLGCTITDDVALIITESSAGTLTATSSPIAVGETSTISTDGTTGGTYTTSEQDVVAVDPTTGLVTGLSAGPYMITYTTPECNGQTLSSTISLTVACSAGTASLTSSSINIGETSTASSAGATAGGSWSSDNTAVATVDASTGEVTGVTAGTANIIYTTSVACGSETTSATITVSCTSGLTVSYDDVSHCSGNTSTLSGSVSDPGESYTYTFNGVDSYGDGWNGSTVDIIVDGVTVVSGFANTNAAAPNAAESTTFSAGVGSVITLSWTAGTYTSEVSWSITTPIGTLLSSGAHGATDGGTTTYSNASYTYAWTPSTDLDDATIASPVASNAATTTYTLTVTNALGCSGTDDVIATVENPTAGTLSGTQTVAPGGTTTISSDGTTGGEWTSSDAAVATVDISTGVVTGVVTGTADITYTVGGTACPDAATITVTVACAADLVVTYDDVLHCGGNSSTLSGTVSDPNALATYTFDGADSFGDGWNGNAVDILVDGSTVVSGFTLTNGAFGTTTFSAGLGSVITLSWTAGSYGSEVSWSIVDPDGATLSSGAYGDTDGGTGTATGAFTGTYAWTPSTDLDDATSASPVASNSTTETYTVVVTNSIGCTGTADVVATVNSPNASTDVQVHCDTYTWIDGNTYTESNNTATFVLTNESGCDSTVTLDLTISNSDSGTDVQAHCDTYTWIDGNTYTASNNTATFVLVNAAGCDSTVTLDLTITNSSTGTDVQTACDSYTWIDGVTYDASNYDVPVTISSQTPGIFTAGASAWPGVLTATTVADGAASQGAQTFTMNVTSLPSGGANFRIYKTTASGSNYFGNLTALVLGENTFTVTAVTFDRLVKFQFSSGDVEFDALSLNGESLFSSIPTFVLTNAAGCDSTVTLDLTILNSTTGTDVQTACESYTWIDGVTYTESTESTGGESSAPTTISTQTPGLFTAGSGTWPGIYTACTNGDGNGGVEQELVINVTSLPSGGANYSVAKTVANGNFSYSAGTALSLGENTITVSAVSFERTVKFRFNSADVEFDALSLNGDLIYGSSTPTFVLTNAAGCDSIVTLDLTILEATTGTDVQTACDSYTWIDGVTYDASNYNVPVSISSQTPGIFTSGSSSWPYVLTATTVADGAASQEAQTFTMNVTSLPSGGANFRVYKTTANGSDYFGNLTAMVLGENTFTVAAATFDRAVKFQFSSGDVEFESLSVNGESIFSPLPTFVLTNAAGCDSIVTLDLTINSSTTGTDVQTACDSYTWIDGNTYTESTSNGGGATTMAAQTPGLFAAGPNTTWTNVFTACTNGDGNGGAQQTVVINVTSLPSGGANYRVFKTTSNGGSFNGNATALSLGVNTLNVAAVTFERTVKFQFSDGAIEFDALSLNGSDAYASAPTFVLTNSAGCDSTVTLDLTINNSSTGTDVQTACDSYTWIDGITYTESTGSAGIPATTISGQTPGIFTSGASSWPGVLTATTVADGAASQGAQTFTMNVTSLPSGGANFRVFKTTANGSNYFGNLTAMVVGENTFTVPAVTFDRAVKFQFSSVDVEFDALSVNGSSVYNPAASAAPTFVLTNAAGCDSTVTLELTIIPVSAGTIEASVDGAVTYSTDVQNIQVGNDIYWNYTAGDATGTFESFEFQWQDTLPGAWSENFGGGANPYNWGAGQTFNPGQTLYVRAKASCGTGAAYSDAVAVNWLTCYSGTQDITATLDAVSIADGDEMTINNAIEWTAPTDAFGEAFHWEYSWDGGSSFNGEWQNNINPATWSDNVGQFVGSGDANLTVRYVATGTNCIANSIMDFDVVLRKPVITVSTISNTLEVCEGGDASASESFTVSGQYIADDDNASAASASHTGILVTPPSGLEVSLDDVTFSSSINISATDGTIASTTVYVRIIAGQDGADASGDIACTAQAATTQNVSATATIQENAEVETSISFTTGTGTCGEVEISVSVNGVESGSGAWSTGLFGQGNFGSVTDVSTTFTTGTFGSTITLTWTTDDGGACNDETTSIDAIFEQPETDMIDNSYTMDTESWLWGGLTDDSWTEPTNWYKYTDDGVGNFAWRRQTVNTPTATDKVYIMANQDAGQCVSATNSALTVEGASMTDLMVANNAILNLAGTASVSGNITNDGTIQATGASMLSIDGSGDQTIDGNEITLNDLEINKSGGNMIMTTPINVNGVLNMTSGNIVNTNDILTVGGTTTDWEGLMVGFPGTLNHTSGIVTGKMRHYFPNSSGAKFFPVGNSAIQRDVTVDFTSAPGESQYLTASYNAGYPQANDGSDLYAGLPLVTSDDQVIQNYDDEGYWEIIPGSVSTGESYTSDINSKAYNVSIRCNDLTGEDNVTHMDRSKVRVIKSAGPGHTSWQGLTHESIVGTDADFTVTASGTGFSFFGAGTEDENALPVELVSFSGDCEDGLVNLEWQTASENNSEDFELEYSRDGVDWSLIHTEPAAGFSTELITYNFEHNQAISGDNYYRLTQNDIDGSSVVYDNLVINASCQSTANGYFSVFPNPSAGSFQVIMNNPEIEGNADLKIVDTKGSVVFVKSIVVNSGINMYVIQQNLAPGIYYINVENASKTTTIVKHSVR